MSSNGTSVTKNNPSASKNESSIMNSIQQLREVAKTRGIDGILTANKHTTFERRAATRISQEQARQQQNLESIVVRANHFCEDVISDHIDPDWLTAFLSMAKEIASPHMQTLWGKIFALELNHAGSFSVKSLRTLEQMTQREAQMFQAACNLSSQIGHDSNHKILLQGHQKSNNFALFKKRQNRSINLGRHKLPYSSFLTLADLGLIHGNELELVNLPQEREFPVTYGNQKLFVRIKNKSACLKYYRFTHIGDELVKLIPHEGKDDYFAELKEQLANICHF